VTALYLVDQDRQPWRQCPHCGVLHDGLTAVVDDPTDVSPDDGSFMVCADCGGWGVLDSTLPGGWRPPTNAETESALADHAFCLTLAAARSFIERRS